jgi:diaminopimelate epimerase
MTTLAFWKMTGAGNDFVVLDARQGLPAPAEALARTMCPRRTAVGADGLIAVTRAAEGEVVVDFLNADGSGAGFCGNGARCVGRYAFLRGLSAAPVRVVFPAQTVTARAAGDDIEIAGPRPFVLETDVRVTLGGVPLVGQRIAAGVGHVVFAEPGESAFDLPSLARALFAARPDLEGQVNVTLVRPGAAGDIRVRTFERGVGETLACGSGALAAALFVAERGAGTSSAELRLLPPAGVPLHVRLDPDGRHATLRGEARVVYRGEIDL